MQASVDRLVTQVSAGYLALQAAAGVVLWILIAASDTVRSGFEMSEDHPEVTDAFFWADLAVIITSAVAAWALVTARSWAPVAVAAQLGGVVYPTVLLVAFVNATGGTAAPALAVMVVVSVCSAWATAMAWRHRPDRA